MVGIGHSGAVASCLFGSHGLRTLAIDSADESSRELGGVVARWFDACNCQAAVVRPDHHVYSVAGDAASLAELMLGLARRLRA